MQTLARDQVTLQVHTRIAIDRVSRDRKFTQRENQTTYIDPSGIVVVRSYVRHHVRTQRVRADIQSQGSKTKMHMPHRSVRCIESHPERYSVLRSRVRRGLPQVNRHIRIVQAQTVQRVLTLRQQQARTRYIQ